MMYLKLMITPELITFIQQELALGVLPENIKTQLVASGWSEEDIQQAFATAVHSKTHRFSASYTPFLQRISNEFTTIFNQTFKIFKENIKTYLVIQSLQGVFLLISFFSIFLWSRIIESSHIPNFIKLGIPIILTIIYSIVSVIPHLMLLYAINDSVHLIGIKEYTLQAVKNIWRFWILLFLIQLYAIWRTILLILVSFLIIAVVGIFLPFANSFIMILYPISIITGAIITVFFYTLYSFAIYVFVSERIGIKESLRRSRYYSSGNVLRILVHGIMLFLVMVVFAIIPYVGFFLSILIGIPFANIYMYSLYKDIQMSHSEFKE